MKLSLAFITHNRKNEILRALDSCVSYITDDMEIVIVDNNSKDGTQSAIKKYLEEQHINYKYYYLEENLGVAGGRNFAFKQCDGEYVFSLDDDAIVITDDIFSKVCKFMDHHQNVVAVSLNVYEPSTDSHLLNTIRIIDSIDYQLMYNFVGGGHVLRKSFFSTHGILYPEKLHFGSEELYASLKAWGHGKEVAYVPEFLIHHMPNVLNRKIGKERDFNILLNIYIIKKLVFPKVIIPLVYCLFVVRMIKNGLWTKEWRIKTKLEISKRYDKNEEYRIPLKTVFHLIRLFRFKDIF